MTRLSGLALLASLALLFPLSLSSQPPRSHRDPAASLEAGLVPGCAGFVAEAAGGSSTTEDASARHGFNLANLDRSVSPCEDFYQFADGGWMKNNPMPADRAAWAIFNKLRDHNESLLHEILEEASKDTKAQPGSNWQKIGDFYASCMDESQVEAAGLKPIQPELQRIAAIDNIASLQDEIARLQHGGANAVFSFGSEQDLKDSTQVIAGAGQGGLGLPDRQYYLDDDARSKQLRAAYVQHVTNMFKLMGDDPSTAAAEAKSVMDAETALAKASKKREDLRDPETNYHPMTLAQLRDLTPHFSWTAYFKEVGAPALASADIGQPDFFKQVDAGTHQRSARRLEDIPPLAPDPFRRPELARQVRRGKLRLLRPHAHRRQADASSLAALRPGHRPRSSAKLSDSITSSAISRPKPKPAPWPWFTISSTPSAPISPPWTG